MVYVEALIKKLYYDIILHITTSYFVFGGNSVLCKFLLLCVLAVSAMKVRSLTWSQTGWKHFIIDQWSLMSQASPNTARGHLSPERPYSLFWPE